MLHEFDRRMKSITRRVIAMEGEIGGRIACLRDRDSSIPEGGKTVFWCSGRQSTVAEGPASG